MNYKTIIINALTLLYWENQITGSSDSRSLIKSAIQLANPSKESMDTALVKEQYESLQVLIIKMMSNETLCKTKELIIHNVRMIAGEEPYVIEIIESALNLAMDEVAIKSHCRSLIGELNDVLRKAEFRKKFMDYSKKVLYGEEEFELTAIARSLVTSMESYTLEDGDKPENTAGVMDFVDFNNEESLLKIFNKAKDKISPEKIIKWPLQALNRLFGEQGGGRRGEFVLIGGLQHHGKSAITMMMTRGAALYNKPALNDPKKKPAIVLISSENDLPINMQTMYKQTVEPTIGRPIKKNDIDPTTAAQLMKEKFGEQGWHFLMFRVNPDEFTFSSLQSLTLGLEANGYEIVVMTFDYLAMISTKGFDNGGITGRDKQALFKRTRNFMVAHDILFITPHQLSTEALAIERDRPSSFLNEILDRAYYNECKTIAQEVDVEINIQKWKQDGEDWLYVGRGKHRGVDDTPHKDRRAAWKFTPIGIPDDINGVDTSSPKPGGNTQANGGGPSWFQTNEGFSDFQVN